jgi:hypothetical protein
LAGITCFATNPGSVRPAARLARRPKAGIPVDGRKLSHEETLRWIVEHQAWQRARKTKPTWARIVAREEVGKEFQTADHTV